MTLTLTDDLEFVNNREPVLGKLIGRSPNRIFGCPVPNNIMKKILPTFLVSGIIMIVGHNVPLPVRIDCEIPQSLKG